MAEEGRAPLRLIDGPPLLRPDEQVFDEMLTGWRHRQLARSLRVATIDSYEATVRRFQRHANAFPWQWTPVMFEEWCADLVATKQVARSTLRNAQSHVRGFCDFICHPAYDWVQVCESLFGSHPMQIVSDGNAAVHVSDHESQPDRRALTRHELQAVFDAADERVAEARRLGRKNWMSWFRDATVMKTIYGFGLRRHEATMLDIADLSANPRAPEFGDYGACRVRHGKASRGSPPKRRTVLCVFGWVPDVLEEWVTEIRPRYQPGVSDAMWPSERTVRVGDSAIARRFAELRSEIGLPDRLGLHALRHSYVTHLIEDGWDPLFVQQQVGHEFASTTALYTGVSSDYRTRTLRAALDRLTQPALESRTP